MSKYGFTGEVKNGLKQIICLTAFSHIAVGEVGGWIASEDNLSQDGDCWVYGNAHVYGNAKVSDNAYVYGKARVYGKAKVYGNAKVSDNACVSGNTKVSGNAHVYGNTHVSGNAHISGNAHVYGKAKVYGDAHVSDGAQIFWIQNIGSRNGTTTFFNSKDGEILVTCGCFFGNIHEFEKRVIETHGDNEHGLVYKCAIQMAKLKIKCKEESK